MIFNSVWLKMILYLLTERKSFHLEGIACTRNISIVTNLVTFAIFTHKIDLISWDDSIRAHHCQKFGKNDRRGAFYLLCSFTQHIVFAFHIRLEYQFFITHIIFQFHKSTRENTFHIRSKLNFHIGTSHQHIGKRLRVYTIVDFSFIRTFAP